jgi:hypothetical protein
MTEDDTRTEPLLLSQFIKNALPFVENDPVRAEVFVLARLLIDTDHELLARIVRSEVRAVIESNHGQRH